MAANVWCSSLSASAEPTRKPQRQILERKRFTDAQIVDGFMKVAFGAELTIEGRVDRIRKFEQPVRVHITNAARTNRTEQVASVISDIRSRIEHLDIEIVGERGKANLEISLVNDRDIGRTARRLFGEQQARRIQQTLEPQCLSGFRKDAAYRIEKSYVILTADAGNFVFLDCAYEEILQALGPINDDATVPWTMFNDNVRRASFGVYDQFLLNILYDPRIRAGMTRDAVKAVLPEVLASAKAFVARRNGLTAP